jgi:cobyrinic acid a,c-diamide synthase
MGIKEQTDPKLEDATKEVYRHEFHSGKMKATLENMQAYQWLKPKKRLSKTYSLWKSCNNV